MTLQRIEESFEEPFAIRLLPDSPRFSAQNRFFNLGLDGGGAGVFSVYKTNGKQLKIVYARDFEPEESMFYQRKLAQATH